MNKSQQPGINTESIMLIKCTFDRYPVHPQRMSTKIDLAYNSNMVDDNCAQGELSLHVEGHSAEELGNGLVFSADINFVGVFSALTSESNLPLDDFIKNQAPAHIYPYAREFLTSLSARSGMPPVILPPINIAAILELKLEADLVQEPVVTEIN